MQTKQNFSTALEALKEGKKVSREGWNGKGMWLQLLSESVFGYSTDVEQQGDKVPKDGGDFTNIIGDDGIGNENTYHIGIIDGNTFYPLHDCILMKTADGMCVAWLASQTDILANDWCILN